MNHILPSLLTTPTQEILPPSITTPILTHPPFILIPGIINLRDLHNPLTAPYILPGLLYRSGALITPSLSVASLTKLRDDLGIKLLVDLRSDGERKMFQDPEIPGLEKLSVRLEGERRDVVLGEFVEDGGRKGYKKMYGEFLEGFKIGFAELFRRIAGMHGQREGMGAVLFHCTAGKDRTGILAGLLLSLLGCPPHIIASEYALSRIGFEPHRAFLLNMFARWRKDWDMETPGMNEFVQMKPEFMLAMLEWLEEEYGGVEGYVRDGLGLSGGEVVRIRGVLKGDEVGREAREGGEADVDAENRGKDVDGVDG